MRKNSNLQALTHSHRPLRIICSHPSSLPRRAPQDRMIHPAFLVQYLSPITPHLMSRPSLSTWIQIVHATDQAHIGSVSRFETDPRVKPLAKKSQDDDSDFYPRHSSYTQKSCKSKVSTSCACLITGCTQRFNRTDSRTSHLRRKHRLLIPRGCWAKTWISKPENRHHYSAAVAEQARANSILSPQTEMEN